MCCKVTWSMFDPAASEVSFSYTPMLYLIFCFCLWCIQHSTRLEYKSVISPSSKIIWLSHFLFFAEKPCTSTGKEVTTLRATATFVPFPGWDESQTKFRRYWKLTHFLPRKMTHFSECTLFDKSRFFSDLALYNFLPPYITQNLMKFKFFPDNF